MGEKPARGQINLLLARATIAGLAIGGGVPLCAATIPSFPGLQIVSQSSLSAYVFGHDRILGTSLDLVVVAPNSFDARECERQTLAEIERLRAILSTYDPQSEINRVQHGAPIELDELAELLDAYSQWEIRSSGAIDSRMANVIRLWKQAANTGLPPGDAELFDAVNAPYSLNVDALGKGYIIDRAVAVARRIAPAGLLNIGGDIRAWGQQDWLINVADPLNPSDNSPSMATVTLRNNSIATSGGYARFFSIGGRRYSHIIDPRTLWPVEQVSSATVVAPDCMTANALSTAAGVLGLEQGRDLIQQTRGTEFLLADDAGNVAQSGAFSPVPTARPKTVNLEETGTKAWPADFHVSVEVALKGPDGASDRGGGRRGGGYKRPYVAVWIENSAKVCVRTITVWGNQQKYVPELSYWWNFKGADKAGFSVTRATRQAGKYTVEWDGKNDAGTAVPQGECTVHVEINREHGRHVHETALIKCDDVAQSAKLKATAESDESTIQFGPRSK